MGAARPSQRGIALVALLVAVTVGGCHLVVDPPRFGAGEAGVEGGTGVSDAAPDRGGDGGGVADGGGEGGGADTDGGSDSAPSVCKRGAGRWVIGAITAAADLNSSDNDAEYYELADGLHAYIGSQRAGGGWRVYRATRSARGQPYTSVVLADKVSDGVGGGDTHFAVSRDGLTAYLATGRPGGSGSSDLWTATRANTSTAWTITMFAPMTALNTSGPEYDPWPSPDGRRLYWVAVGAQGGDLVFAERSSPAGTFGAPKPVPGVNTSSAEDHPALSADERLIIFGSNRPGGQGDRDLWYATRSSLTGAFSTPKPVPKVNGPARDGEAFLTADGCTLYFASWRAGGMGGADIYRAEVLASP